MYADILLAKVLNATKHLKKLFLDFVSSAQKGDGNLMSIGAQPLANIPKENERNKIVFFLAFRTE